MRHVLTVLRRELATYFVSPLGYIVIAFFLGISGLVFSLQFGSAAEALFPAREVVEQFFFFMFILLLLTVPAITMQLLAEEWRSGTMETLMTNPVRDVEVVLGKYLGALIFFVILLAPTGLYFVALGRFAEPDWGPVISGYLGLLLMGSLMIALGLLASSLTRSQIIAFMATFTVLLVLHLLGWLSFFVHGPLRDLLSYMSMANRYEGFVKGGVWTKDIVYFPSLTILLLFGTVKVVESRRWR